jgi:hypothetical protein
MILKQFLEEFKFLEITHASGSGSNRVTTNFNDLNAAFRERYTFEVHYKNKPSEMFKYFKIKDFSSEILPFKIMKIRVETQSFSSLGISDQSHFYFVLNED